jgi:hypothetical protein
MTCVEGRKAEPAVVAVRIVRDDSVDSGAGWLSKIDSFKTIGTALAVVVAALWTWHLYTEDADKESAAAIIDMSKSIDEIKFVCHESDPSTWLENLDAYRKFAVGAKPLSAPDSKVLALDESKIAPVLCLKAIFDTRQMTKRAYHRISKPWFKSGDWSTQWSALNAALEVLTKDGPANGGNVTKLEDAWRRLLALKGLD